MSNTESILKPLFNGTDKPEFNIGETVTLSKELTLPPFGRTCKMKNNGIVTGVRGIVNNDGSRFEIIWSYEVIMYCNLNRSAFWYGGSNGLSGYTLLKENNDD